MSESSVAPDVSSLTEPEKHTALFAQLVMQSTSMALMLMGRAPNPMTGKTEIDLDGARLFIEQLEMLEVKTRGNLGPEEQHLLRQNLMHARMSFVEAVNAAKSAGQPATEPGATPAEPDDSSRKWFSKNYGEG
jgi:hypothetical protein